jgi:hypothetical protein
MNPETWVFTPSEDVRAGRMLLHGRLTATVVSAKTGQHITVKIACKTRSPEGEWLDSGFLLATHCFVSVPRPDDFRGDKIGVYYPQKSTLWADRFADPARIFALKQVFLYASGLPTHPQVESVLEELNCGVCERPLTDPISVERGIGPTCFGQDTGSSHQEKRWR